MSEQERCIRRMGRAIIVIVVLSVSMGGLLVFQAFADVNGDLRDIRDSLKSIEEGWWRAFLPGGAIIAGLLSAVGILWKDAKYNRKLVIEEVKKHAEEREEFRRRLDSLIKNGEMSQTERRDAVDLLVREIRDQTRSISALVDEKKKSETGNERSDQATVRPGVRKR